MSHISLKNLIKRHGTKTVLDGLSLDVADGEIVALLGPSGCGKSTLLRCIAGLEKPNAGQIALDGRIVFDSEKNILVQPRDRNVGFVFQSFALWPHMTVMENVSFPLKTRKKVKNYRARVEKILSKVRCAELASRYPSELSGGQQQRVALGRALIAEPKVMLLDEPLSNLDALLRIELRQQLREIHRSFKFTGLFVTHDQAEALHVGDRIALMRDGRVEQIGTPKDVYEAPATPNAARFFGVENLVELSSDSVWPSLRNLCAGIPGPVTLGFRALDLSMQAGRNAEFGADHIVLGSGWIKDTIFLGNTVEVSIGVHGETVRSAVSRASDWMRDGAEITVAVPASRLLIYSNGRLLPRLVRSSGLKLA
ncbi:MAG: ABC transporter ATP-binding protein [Alphaproteobacteria bacterium]